MLLSLWEHYFFISDLKLYARVLLTDSQEGSLFPVAQLYCMSDWLIQWMKLIQNLQKAPVKNHTAQWLDFTASISLLRRKTAAIVAYNRKWHKTSLTLTGSCLFSQHERKKNTVTLFSAACTPQQFPALPCPKLWPVFVLSLHVETTDSGFPFSLDKGVIRILWVMPDISGAPLCNCQCGNVDQVEFAALITNQTGVSHRLNFIARSWWQKLSVLI